MRDLPASWVRSTVGEIFLEIKNGSSAPQNKLNLGLPITRIETIQKNQFDLKRVQHIEDPSPEFIEKYKYDIGDIAFSHINSYEHVGKTALYQGVPEILLHGMNLLRLRMGHSSVDPKFARYFMLSKEFRDEVRERVGHAVNQVSINQKNLSQVPFTVPPLNEQKRIVEKLEKLLAKVEAVQERLNKIPAILKRFRQSVLAAACSGKLTADWRVANDDFEPFDVDGLRRYRLLDATPSQATKINAIYNAIEESDSNDLPAGWRFATLNKLSESFDYGTSAKSSKTGAVPVLRMGNVQNGEIDWSDLVFASDKNEIAKYRLLKDTVLFNRTNSPELVGKTAIYRGEREAIFAGYLIRVNNFEILDPEYLNYCLNTTFAKEFCRHVKTDGVSQSNINAQKLGAFEVPFPPLEEQKEIVCRVEELFKFADQVEERYKKARSYTDKLAQSILAKAFRGELVPQDPNDEPASVLMEKIKSNGIRPVNK